MSETRQIFRQVALERLSTPEQLDQTMRITSPLGWLLLIAAMVVVVASILLSVIGTVPIKVTAQGMLISPGGVLSVISESQGRIRKLHVHQGDNIVVGQVVAEIEQPDIRQELDLAQSERNELERQKQLVLEFHARDSKAQAAFLSQRKKDISLGIKHTQERIAWLREREKAEQELWDKKFIGKQKYLDTKIEIKTAMESASKAQNELNQVEREETTLVIGKERELLDKEMAIGSLQRKIEGLNDKLRRQSAVVSAYAGTVAEAKVNEGELVEKSTALFSLIPSREDTANRAKTEGGRLIAILYTSPTDGKKVHPGMEVQIAPATVKREEYGFMLGTVRHVAEIPSTSEGMMRILKNQQIVQTLSGGGAPFEVIVDLITEPTDKSRFKWSSSRGPDIEINTGTLAEATIAVRHVRLISLAIPAFEQWLH
jgi:HlyD family secretion protein